LSLEAGVFKKIQLGVLGTQVVLTARKGKRTALLLFGPTKRFEAA
jgi:hypothetical protein